jgi:hypothetical protein
VIHSLEYLLINNAIIYQWKRNLESTYLEIYRQKLVAADVEIKYDVAAQKISIL